MKFKNPDVDFSKITHYLSTIKAFVSPYLPWKKEDADDDKDQNPYVLLFGDALIAENVITENQLKNALAIQTQRLKQEGKNIRMGELIVSLGYATEDQIINGINRYYKISAKSLSDNIDELITKSRISYRGKKSYLHPPIMVKLAIAVLFIVGLTIMTLSYFVLDREKGRLYQQTIKMGKINLSYFTNNAKVPLINDNILRLNTLIKESASVEGVSYAFILDKKGMIKAHTDFNKIGTKFAPLENARDMSQEGDLTYYRYTDAAGSEILNLSRPITFKDKHLGEVNIGISLDFIQKQIQNEKSFIIFLSFFIIILGIGMSIVLGINFSKPIDKLVTATQEIAKGNFDHQVRMRRQDEFGNLALAFNFMSHELKMKSLLQDTFGRYVSPAILKMIMADPSKTWLKGTRNEASILFTDIRGFTSYSESREPEKIVESLNEYFAIATKSILDNGGYVDKFIGDAVLGVFGVPLPQADHAERAVRAAVEMQRTLHEAGNNGNELVSQVGIGINSGVVVSGNLGSQVKMEYSIIGDSVNVASRLNSLAGSGEVIISKSVYELTSDIVTVEALPPQKVKGKSQLIECFRVTSIRSED
ncbi:MAG: HAMP domain-containing protein [Deltaproteobacteria bacterium]|nr:HAMP domain-containing protein [Deltaproteobacteria bacterium]MBN2688573.1 HAMP domain-containing protein [Deltaproteobacteria bacterium]